MSARDELTDMARDYIGAPPDEVEDALNAYHDEILHEGAERIRSQKGPDHKTGCDYCLLYDISADLIDPEAQR